MSKVPETVCVVGESYRHKGEITKYIKQLIVNAKCKEKNSPHLYRHNVNTCKESITDSLILAEFIGAGMRRLWGVGVISDLQGRSVAVQ